MKNLDILMIFIYCMCRHVFFALCAAMLLVGLCTTTSVAFKICATYALLVSAGAWGFAHKMLQASEIKIPD